MDLDTILGILFFIVFVVLPLFSGAGRRGQPGRTRPGQRTGAPTGRGATASTGADQPPVTLAEIRRRVEEAQRREQEELERRRAAGSRRRSAPRTPEPLLGREGSQPERRLIEGGTASASLGPEGTAPATTGRPYVLGPEGAFPDPYAGGHVIGREGAPSTPRDRGASPAVRRQPASLLGREGVPRGEGGTRVVRPTVTPTVGTRARGARGARAAAAEIGRQVGARPAAGTTGATLGRAWALRTDEKSVITGLIWHEVLSRPRALRHWRER